MLPSGLRFEGTAFWVRHRHREYGPFDYQWAGDMAGIELFYSQTKFGEFCSADEVFADLREFQLPMRVVEVSAVVCGAVILGLLNGYDAQMKKQIVEQQLKNQGLQRFADSLEGWDA
ncbi:MAG: hypothetical protein VB858_14600 [Planctomycetaceae bacterium]